MGKKKKITLPKDFSEILKRKHVDEILGVFEYCDINATGGYGKQTTPAFDLCPDEVLRWLVENGADLSLVDTWGNTPLHNRARSRRSNIKTLLELGANPNSKNKTGNTPLHNAAYSHNAENAKLLIEYGAVVDSKNNKNITPLELGLRSCENIDIEDTVKLSKVLLELGAKKPIQ